MTPTNESIGRLRELLGSFRKIEHRAPEDEGARQRYMQQSFAYMPECAELLYRHGETILAALEARELDRQAPGEWGGYEAFEQFLAAEIDSAPEALRRLGEWLGNVLDEDHFATANRLVLGAMLETSDAIRKVAASKAAPQPPAQEQGDEPEAWQVRWMIDGKWRAWEDCTDWPEREPIIGVDATEYRPLYTRAAGAEDARDSEVFKEGWEYGYWHGQQTPNGYSKPSDCQADWHEYKQQREAAIASQAQEGER